MCLIQSLVLFITFSGRGEEEVGIESGSNPIRSNPVNMPHRPYHLIETSSGTKLKPKSVTVLETTK